MSSVSESLTPTLLTVEDLHVHFKTDDGLAQAVRGVSLDLLQGETLGIVGESGSGKSVTNLALMGLVPKPPGHVKAKRIDYRGQELLGLSQRRFSRIRGRKIAMVFQDPMTSLNPFLTIAEQMTEVTRRHLGHSRKEALAHAIEMLERVGIPAASRRIRGYPHEFSGGMRQRVMIAMALSCDPDLLIADEPTTALDVTVQAQVLELMKDLQRQRGTSIILITHDLGVIANICHRVLVMYAGRIVEEAEVDSLFANPRHPYTRGLLTSVPTLDGTESSGYAPSPPAPLPEGEGRTRRSRLTPIEGQPPDMASLPPGCSFAPRCPLRQPPCDTTDPPLFPRGDYGRHACLVEAHRNGPVEAAKEL